MQGIDLQRKGKELAAELDYYVKSHFEQLVEQFVDCFSEYCNKIYEMQRQGRVTKKIQWKDKLGRGTKKGICRKQVVSLLYC